MFWRRKPPMELAFLVFGLGNPGARYAHTRHNVGWWVLDELARRHGVTRTAHLHAGQVDYTKLAELPAALIKPTTFMNRSGQCVAGWLKACPQAAWVVVSDDISMAVGKCRYRAEGSAGGHKGIASIIASLGRQDFTRIKLGVGEPAAGMDAADYVLEAPGAIEQALLAKAIQRAADAVEALAGGGSEQAIAALSRPE